MKPKVLLTNSFDEWRLITNSLSDEIGDLALVYSADGTGEHAEAITPPTDLIVGINDLNTRKLKRTGDTMTGSLHFDLSTLTANNPFLECAATWNNNAVDFSGILFNITDTASGAGSLLLDFRTNGAPKFGVDAYGAIIQKLSGTYMARDIVSGSRHVREYQDMNDGSANGLPATKIEWGFTWNAGWNGASYTKDRSNAGDHAIMHRIDNGFRSQYWFSDGTTAGSGIAFVKYVDWDFPAGTAWYDLTTTFNKNVTIGSNKVTFNATSGNTLVAGTFTAQGAATLSSTLGVSGATTLTSLGATTGTFSGLITANAGVTINGGTVTTSTPAFNFNQTWNESNTTFHGMILDITNTASNVGSMVLDYRSSGVSKFGVRGDGAVLQKLSGEFLARDVVSGSRHVREYQDLPDNNANGLSNTKIEWGFTWNAKWDTSTSSYIKDRSNAGDHAIMHRIDNGYRSQYWFSDGTSIGSPITFVKKLDFDFPANTAWMDLTLSVLRDFSVNTNKFTVASATGNTVVAGSLNVAGTITGNGSGLTLIPNGALVNSSITIGTTPISLGATATTLTGLTDVTATTFNGTLNGNANTVTNGVYTTGTYADPAWITSLAKAKVGLSAVENTALSTWTGTTNITTLGNVATGTWNATTIAVNKGGTGLTTIGSNVLLGGTAAGGAYEAKTLFCSDGTVLITHTAGQIDIKTSGIFPGSVTFAGDFAVGTPAKFTVAAATGNTIISGTLDVGGITALQETSATTFVATTKVTTPIAEIGDTVVDTGALTTTSITPVALDTLAIATYRSACFEIQAVDATSGNYHRVTINAIHNGTTADSVEYGATAIGGACATFAVDISGGNMRLMVTPTSANSTTFKVRTSAMKV